VTIRSTFVHPNPFSILSEHSPDDEDKLGDSAVEREVTELSSDGTSAGLPGPPHDLATLLSSSVASSIPSSTSDSSAFTPRHTSADVAYFISAVQSLHRETDISLHTPVAPSSHTSAQLAVHFSSETSSCTSIGLTDHTSVPLRRTMVSSLVEADGSIDPISPNDRLPVCIPNVIPTISHTSCCNSEQQPLCIPTQSTSASSPNTPPTPSVVSDFSSSVENVYCDMVGVGVVDDFVRSLNKSTQDRRARCRVSARLNSLSSKGRRRARQRARRIVNRRVSGRLPISSELLELTHLKADHCPLSVPSDDGTKVHSELSGSFLINWRSFVGSGTLSAVSPFPRADFSTPDILWDTGAHTVMREATLWQAVRAGAINTSDIITLNKPRKISGYDASKLSGLVACAVRMWITLTPPAGEVATRFQHVVLIVPHLSHEFFLGRDVFWRMKAGSNVVLTRLPFSNAGAICFGDVARAHSSGSSVKTDEEWLSSVPLCQMGEEEDMSALQAVVVEDVMLHEGRPTPVTVRANGQLPPDFSDQDAVGVTVSPSLSLTCGHDYLYLPSTSSTHPCTVVFTVGQLPHGSTGDEILLQAGTVVGTCHRVHTVNIPSWCSSLEVDDNESVEAQSATVSDRGGHEDPDTPQSCTSPSTTPTTNADVPFPEGLTDTAAKEAFRTMWEGLPQHLREIKFELHGWNADQITRLWAMLLSNESVISKDKWDIGSNTSIPFHIHLKDGVIPAASRPYRYSPFLQAKVDVEIDKLLAAGIIRPSHSPWAAPVVAVLKKDGRVRITVNYKELNARTNIPQHPLPIIEDVLATLGGSQVFSVADITSGYFTSSIDSNSIPLTAMVTGNGLYEWTRMPQGVAGGPAHFTRLMQVVLSGLKRTQAFIDDVICFSRTIDEHLLDLATMFDRLRLHGMKLSPSKVTLGAIQVKFLGHIVTKEGVKVDPSKLSALANMPVPRDVSALRAWVGLANYYRRFIPNMSMMLSPLTDLFRKGEKFEMTAERIARMKLVNQQLIDSCTLAFPDFSAAASGERPLELHVDASQTVGFGAVLSQKDAHGCERILACASRVLMPNEKHWDATDCELGAVVFGVRKFRHWLWGCRFIIYTDHRALVYLEKLREKSARVTRMFEFLAPFQFELRYRKGTCNSNADGFSRNALGVDLPDQQVDTGDCEGVADSVDAFNVVVDIKEPVAKRTQREGDKNDLLKLASEYVDIVSCVLNNLVFLPFSCRTGPIIHGGGDVHGREAGTAHRIEHYRPEMPLWEMHGSGDASHSYQPSAVSTSYPITRLNTIAEIAIHTNTEENRPHASIDTPTTATTTTNNRGMQSVSDMTIQEWSQWQHNCPELTNYLRTLGGGEGSSCSLSSNVATGRVGRGIADRYLLVRVSGEILLVRSRVTSRNKRGNSARALTSPSVGSPAPITTTTSPSSVSNSEGPTYSGSMSDFVEPEASYSLQFDNEHSRSMPNGLNFFQQYAIVVPLALRPAILDNCHGTSWAGHCGVERMLGQIRQQFYWPTMEADAAWWRKHCLQCQSRDGRPTLVHGFQSHSWPIVLSSLPSRPWKHISVDWFGAVSESTDGSQYVLVVRDRYSGYIELFAARPGQFTSQGTAHFLVDFIFTRHDCPETIISDRGSQFMSALSEHIFQHMRIRHLKTTAYHPQCNGSAESVMKVIARMLCMLVADRQNDWDLYLPHLMKAYNNTKHLGRGASPFELVHGRKPQGNCIRLEHTVQSILGDEPSLVKTDQDFLRSLEHRLTYLDIRVRQRHNAILQRNANRTVALMEDGEEPIIPNPVEKRKQVAKISKAFGLGRLPYRVGNLVWVYDNRSTYQGPDDRRRSQKLLLKWHGPLEVVEVGRLPTEASSTEPGAMSGSLLTLVVKDGAGRTERVSMHRVKMCYHPGVEQPPEGFPNGVTEYFLSRRATGATTTAFISEEISETDHVWIFKAVIDHRLTKFTRGYLSLEYCVEWQDGSVTWEVEESLSDTILDMYWMGLVRDGKQITHSDCVFVKNRTAKATEQLMLERKGLTLPEGKSVLPKPASDASLNALLHEGTHIAMSFIVLGRKVVWYCGIIRRVVPRRGGRKEYVIHFEDGDRLTLALPLSQYDDSVGREAGTFVVLTDVEVVTSDDVTWS
jgi:hypothetical protein